MSGAVYILCAATSFLCTVMLLRGYFKSRVRLLLWSGLCFLGLTLDNVFLYIDVVVYKDVSMTALLLLRRLPGLIAITLLLVGLVWDSK